MATIGERFIEALGGITAAQLEEIRTRAYEAGYYDGNDEPASGDLKSYGYKLVAGGGGRELDVTPEKALQTAWKLWQSSLVAGRALSLKRDHILDKGVSPQAPGSDALQAIFDAFEQANKWPRRHKEFVKQLFGFGEQCFPVFVRKSDGRVRLGYIDPEEIERVITHPDNALEQWAVVVKPLKAADSWAVDTGRRVYRIVREYESQPTNKKLDGRLVTHEQAVLENWESEMLKEQGLERYSGSCFYEGVNRVSNQARGYTDLLAAADWIDQVDNALFGLLDRETLAGFFSFDVTLTNADDPTVAARAKAIRKNPPARGSVNVHNDAEKWDMFAPDLGQTGTVASYRSGLGHVLGGLGFPVHWYGFGDDANRATAAAQGAPTEKSLAHDQGIVHDWFMMIFTFVRDQAIIAGNFTPSDKKEEEIIITMPEITPSDTAAAVGILGPLAQALMAAVQSGWNTNETAAKAWAKALAEYGIEVDAANETKAAAKAQADTAQAEAEIANRQLSDRLAAAGNGAGRSGEWVL